MIFHSPVCVFIDVSQMMHKCFFVCKKTCFVPETLHNDQYEKFQTICHVA